MLEPTVAVAWSDLGVALLIALFGSAVAALWPWLVARQRGVRFQGLIRREMEEIGPWPDKLGDRPWWQHLSKRFVHEEIFARQHISENRDFVLSLKPTVTYHVSQLWIAFEKRDSCQWLYHLGELSTNKYVGSKKLRRAASDWRWLLEGYTNSDATISVRTPPPMTLASQPPGLFETRLLAYGALLPLTRPKPDGQTQTSPDALTDWYYASGNGLLLSGDALRAFLDARKTLRDPSATTDSVKETMSALRTELKIDLGTRHPDERRVELARPIERLVY